VERPPSEEEQSEQGRVLRFPRLWVPPDGIEPLVESDAEPEPAEGADGKTREPGNEGSPSERPAFEAGGFWERGDMQEFVGVAANSGPSTTSSDDTHPIGGAADDEMPRSSVERLNAINNGERVAGRGVTTDFRRAMSSARYGWAKVAGVAALALGVLVGGGIGLAAALHSAPQPPRDASATRLGDHRAVSQGTRLAATGALVLPLLNSGRSRFAATHPKTTATRHGLSRPAHHAPAVTPVQPVRYVQPTPPTSAPAPSASEASSSGGSSGATAPPPAQAQTAQSVPHQAAPPARPSPSGALTCISNCG
jgi:hypothetical protein